MITSEQDPDVVRWGLHTLIGEHPFADIDLCNSVTLYDTDCCQVGYVEEGYGDLTHLSFIENDAVIAHSFQEELSRVAAVEASGIHNSTQESILAQDWCAKTDDHQDDDYCERKAHVNDQMEDHFVSNGSKELQDAPSCSSCGERSFNMEQLCLSLDELDDPINLPIEDDCTDGVVGERIRDLDYIPLVPKVNGEMPSEDEEVSDHQRLLDRLKLYDLVENLIEGDGNCQFRALSDQLYHSAEHHKFIRELVVKQLKVHRRMYEGCVPMDFTDYLKKMSKSGEWGDHVTLQAAADAYGVRILIITSFKDTCCIEILPHSQKSKRVIFLSFWAEVHYNSIYPEGA